MSDVDLIIVVLKLDFELQGVIIAASFFFNLVLVISYIVSVAIPANTA